MTNAVNCPFCDSSERVLKENDNARVLLSNPHKVPGHFLVIPKKHIEKPWDLSHEELTDIFDLVFLVEQKILGKLGEGVDIRQNYRPFLNQDGLKVNHVAFHVIPRSPDDYIYTVSEKFEENLYADLDAAEAKAVADLLR
jgi:diadenosine tetraphosphate (Ap4A) HIT family hydrolase